MDIKPPRMDAVFYDKDDTSIKLEVAEVDGNITFIASRPEDSGKDRELIILELTPRSAELLEHYLENLRRTRRD